MISYSSSDFCNRGIVFRQGKGGARSIAWHRSLALQLARHPPRTLRPISLARGRGSAKCSPAPPPFLSSPAPTKIPPLFSFLLLTSPLPSFLLPPPPPPPPRSSRVGFKGAGGRMLTLRSRAAGLLIRAPELCNGVARMSSKSRGPDEWWAVDGEILRLRPDFTKGYILVNMEEPDPRPKPLNYRRLFGDRMTRMQEIRIRDNSQEVYWEAYMERFTRTREEWEKLYWDGVPRAPDQNPIAKRPIDHYQVLGLRRRHNPYSPLELKAAFRDKAMLYHPENNREKDPTKRAANMAKFRQVWESYKNLQNRRSW